MWRDFGSTIGGLALVLFLLTMAALTVQPLDCPPADVAGCGEEMTK